MSIQELVFKQRNFFHTHQTIDVNYRISYLKKLRNAIYTHETKIHDALKKDLGKSETEGFMCEVGMTLSELTYQIKHIKNGVNHIVMLPALLIFQLKVLRLQSLTVLSWLCLHGIIHFYFAWDL